MPPPRATGAGPTESIAIAFEPGSAALPQSATDPLKQLAAKRGQGVIAVTGYGEATSSDPAAQSNALTLGFTRAQAVANALTAAGVPTTSVRVSAEAGGRGASARLLH